MYKKIFIALAILLLCYSPVFIAIANQKDFNLEVNSPYLNGLITACGVFVAFISASVISKAKDIDSFDFLMMRTTLLMFIGSVVYLSYGLIVESRATILNLVMFSLTLTFGSFTAWGIMHTLFRKSHQASQ